MFNLSEKKKLGINLFSSLFVLGINLLINFGLSPFIVKHLGVAANGYIQLANNFVSYAMVISQALNSMSSRFITVELHKDNSAKAQKYYSSVFFGNILLSLILLIPTIFIIIYLDSLIKIPADLVIPVKCLFSLVFLNYFINIMTPDWNVATFATNNLYMQSIAAIISNFIKLLIIVVLFSFFSIKVWYVGIASLFATVVLKGILFFAKKRLLPNLKVKLHYLDLKALWEMISSGIWNSVNQAGVMLIQGLDLLISNVTLGSVEMGVLSLAKIFPTIMSLLSSTITNVFAPNLTIHYAKGRIDDLAEEVFKAGKITTIMMTLPYCAFLFFGGAFFRLWVPGQDAEYLQLLSVISGLGYLFTSGTSVLFQVFAAVNRLKLNSIVVIISGIISCAFTLILVETTNLGLFAICGVSSILNLLRNVFFTVPYAAYCLDKKKTFFLPLIGNCVKAVLSLALPGLIINRLFVIETWGTFILVCILFSITGLLANYFIVLNKQERNMLISKVLRK